MCVCVCVCVCVCGGVMGQIVYREYIVCRGVNVSCSLASVTEL